MSEPLFYVKGREIWKRPIETQNDDGSMNITLGFHVCTASEWISPETIAGILNFAEGKPKP